MYHTVDLQNSLISINSQTGIPSSWKKVSLYAASGNSQRQKYRFGKIRMHAQICAKFGLSRMFVPL